MRAVFAILCAATLIAGCGQQKEEPAAKKAEPAGPGVFYDKSTVDKAQSAADKAAEAAQTAKEAVDKAAEGK